MKIISIFILTAAVLVGCNSEDSQTSINPDDYAETVAYVAKNFETADVSQSSSSPEYLQSYNQESLAKEVTVYTNQSNEIVYIQFQGISSDMAQKVLHDIGSDKNDDIKMLVNNPDDFEKKHNQRYIANVINDKIGVHVLALEDDLANKMGRDGIYTVNIFYNLNIYNDFMNK